MIALKMWLQNHSTTEIGQNICSNFRSNISSHLKPPYHGPFHIEHDTRDGQF